MAPPDLTRWPASYYAASVGDSAPLYAPLQGDAVADVCVIGAGFSGLNTAIDLAAAGRDVIVLEAGRVGWGASGRNGGQVNAGLLSEGRLRRSFRRSMARADADALIAELTYQGHAVIKDRISRFEIDCDLGHGHVMTASKPRHWRMLTEHYDDYKRIDPAAPVRLVPKQAQHEVIASDVYHGALVNDSDMHLNPLKLCLGEARGATSLGARIHEHTPVVNLRPGAPNEIETATGTIRAKTVVLTGGAYHRLLERQFGGYVLPAGSFIVATEPLEADLIPDGRAVHDTNEIVDYFRMSPDNRLLFGGRCNYTGHEPADIARILRPRLEKIFPQIAGARIDYEWGGALGVTVTRVPHLGRIGDQIYFQQGFSGHGVNTTHLFAEMTARAVLGDSERFDLFANVPQWRLPGRWLGGRMLAAGMTWFKLTDRM